VVGNLFKSRGRQREKTNLMVFIRPTILRSRADAQAMTDRRYGYVRAQQYQQDPYREPTLDELVREYMGMEPPPPPPSVPAPLDPRALVPVQERGKDAPPLDPSLYLPSVRPGDQVVAPTPVPQSQVPR
jgi:general secretion pathway protein D